MLFLRILSPMVLLFRLDDERCRPFCSAIWRNVVGYKPLLKTGTTYLTSTIIIE